ncbi:MAG TPA: UDP-N-acetylglucosamine 2-epimerase [Verrucomicrobiae bacterium]|nr:UDP-N-acetylglucosamine 2-epimerase [Verrucomicrobiae bacterium]
MTLRRRIAVLSTGRQDWGILRELCRLLRDDPGFDLQLLLGGMHCSDRFGRTSRLVIEEGFEPREQLSWIPETGALEAERQAGEATRMVAQALRKNKAEALLLVGDRFETAAATLGATLARLPIIHLHGGEETEGAFDNALRHAITKLSHLHFTSHPQHTARIVAMGEDPATVHTVGAPGLDNLLRKDLADRAELEQSLGLKLRPPVVVVTLHPVTLSGNPAEEVAALVAAMDAVEATYIITLPNVDPGNEFVRHALMQAAKKPARAAVDALGERRFWGLLRIADAMLGNSSSALIEAPAVGLPAVNIGERQKGRLRGENVLDAQPEKEAIVAALQRALTPQFRKISNATPAPFGKGGASAKIVSVLRAWTPPQPPVKRLYQP